MNVHEPSVAGLTHPEWVNGRRLWMDTPMRDLIGRIRFGDPVKGWEGDERLSLYWDGDGERFELWRLEDDGEYRFVCRSGPGVAFDERVIDALVSWDGRRRRRRLDEEINDHNARLDAERDHHHDEWVGEEIAPRLRHALRSEL